MAKTHVLERTQVVPLPVERAFDFFDDPRNLARITPDWLHFRVAEEGPLTMREGVEIRYRVRPFLLPRRWTSRITRYHPPVAFVDEQVQGPYAFWRHQHAFRAIDAANTAVTDRVEYALPFGVLGELAHALFVRRRLEAIFRYRERAIEEILGTASEEEPTWPPRPANPW
ncbi:MAG TPA: SRPBCC family protein [Longimicrobiales bacterium]|nr:SRPBCC family protein [Longimicrobiales bacterium]